MVWGEDSGKLWICFNRDEQRTRPPAEDLALHAGSNGPVAYARDPKGGGTWFAVSSRGFAVALLNHYNTQELAEPSHYRSRGLLVKELAECGSAEEAAILADQSDFEEYHPCHLFICDHQFYSLQTWDGNDLIYWEDPDCILTTSSYKAASVIKWRTGWWKNLSAQSLPPDEVARQLRKVNPDKPAFGAAMDRDDARTVSQIQAELRADGFTISYRRREPDGVGFEDPMEIRYPAGS
jgi:uncharacterized protein with NRDE domain